MTQSLSAMKKKYNHLKQKLALLEEKVATDEAATNKLEQKAQRLHIKPDLESHQKNYKA